MTYYRLNKNTVGRIITESPNGNFARVWQISLSEKSPYSMETTLSLKDTQNNITQADYEQICDEYNNRQKGYE